METSRSLQKTRFPWWPLKPAFWQVGSMMAAALAGFIDDFISIAAVPVLLLWVADWFYHYGTAAERPSWVQGLARKCERASCSYYSLAGGIMAAVAVGALWMAWTGEEPPPEFRQPPPYFTHTDARVHKQATDEYYVTVSVRNTTNGMARELVSQVMVMDQFLGQRRDAILNDNNDPHRYAAQLGPQTPFTFVGTGLDKRDVMQPFFVAVWLRYTDAHTSQVCTQADYYVFRGFKPTGRLEPVVPEESQRIEAYLMEQDQLLFSLPAKDCLS